MSVNAARNNRANLETSNIAPLRPSVENQLGNILIKNKIIAAEDLSRALHRQLDGESKLSDILQASGALNEDQLLAALAEQTNLRTVNLDIERPDPRLLAHFPPEHCLRHSFVPWREQQGKWIIAIEDPTAPCPYQSTGPPRSRTRFCPRAGQ